MNESMPRQPAPRRQSLRRARISGGEVEKFSWRERVQSHTKLQHEFATTQIARVPLGVRLRNVWQGVECAANGSVACVSGGQ